MRTKQPKVTEIKEILLENFYYYFAQTIYNTQKNELEHIRDKYNINLSGDYEFDELIEKVKKIGYNQIKNILDILYLPRVFNNEEYRIEGQTNCHQIKNILDIIN